MPLTLEDTSPYYYAVLFHEYFHKRLLHDYDLRDFILACEDDYQALEEVAVESATALLLNSLSIFPDVRDYEVNYIRTWRGKISNPALTCKLLPVLKSMTESVLQREVAKQDIPIEIRVILGIF